jgi:5-formyltetrahydrofolate cyclo-ligase
MDGAIEAGIPTPFEQMGHIDLVNVGSVAVTRQGGRTGKGAGFADLELALLRETGVVDATTVVAGTAHALSVVADDAITMTATDSPLDWVVTPDEAIATHTPYTTPLGVDWSLVQPDQIDSIPILAMLQAQRIAQADD